MVPVPPRPKYVVNELRVTVSVLFLPFSNAHCWIAPSIKRRLLMQVFLRAVSRALMKFGIAIAAKRPMIATTIMISTSVKPALREDWIFILRFLRREQAAGGLTLLRLS